MPTLDCLDFVKLRGPPAASLEHHSHIIHSAWVL